MRKRVPPYRKSKKSPLKKEWRNVPKLEGGPYWPICNCCNGGFGPIHYKKNKRLMHRFIRHRQKQQVDNMIREDNESI
jgi:hypothetical protein